MVQLIEVERHPGDDELFEERLAEVAERPLDLAFTFRVPGLTRLDFGPMEPGELQRWQLDAAAVAAAPITTWATDLGGLDFFDAIDSPQGPLYYEDLIARAEPRHVAGVRVQLASIHDVIASKATTARPKDVPVVDELRRIAARRSAATPAPPRRPTLANSLDRPGGTLGPQLERGRGR